MLLMNQVIFPEYIVEYLREFEIPKQEASCFCLSRISIHIIYTGGWMEMYLKYVHWYASVALAPDVTIDALFDAPIYVRTWFIGVNHFQVWTSV